MMLPVPPDEQAVPVGEQAHPPREVVFLHGQPGAGSDWNQVLARLPAGVRGYAPDRPGYRSSPHGPSGLVANAEQLLADLDSAAIERVVLVGHSYGGGVAITAAALAPERVDGLVLISSIGPGCLDGWDRLLAAPLAGPVCAVTAWWLTPWAARARLARIERRLGRPLEPHEYVNWDGWANARHPGGAMWRTFLTEQRDLVRNLDLLEARLADVRAPSLILADPADTMIPVATAHELHRLLPGSQLRLLARGGHSLPRRVPEQVAAALAGFLADLPAAESV